MVVTDRPKEDNVCNVKLVLQLCEEIAIEQDDEKAKDLACGLLVPANPYSTGSSD
jgi:hypothetical protein